MDISIGEVFRAYEVCLKGKGDTPSAMQFTQNLGKNIRDLTRELQEDRYEPGRSTVFIIKKPKLREVWAAGFRDRIVHHIVYNRIGAEIEKTFVYGSSACIPGKGTHFAGDYLEGKIRSLTRNWTEPGYYLKLDISNFFVSINKEILEHGLRKRIKCPETLKLALIILHNDPTVDPIFAMKRKLLDKVEDRKQLAKAEKGYGLPIGNLTSQFFANVYMDELDQFIMRVLKPYGYVRYVDDFILLSRNYANLEYALEEIEFFLSSRLHLELNPKKTIINSVYNGVDVTGRIIKPYRKVSRKGVGRNLREKIRQGDITQGGINSSLGILRQSKSYNERRDIHILLNKYGHRLDKDYTKIITVS